MKAFKKAATVFGTVGVAAVLMLGCEQRDADMDAPAAGTGTETETEIETEDDSLFDEDGAATPEEDPVTTGTE